MHKSNISLTEVFALKRADFTESRKKAELISHTGNQIFSSAYREIIS